MKRSVFIQEAKKILEPPLNDFGYSFNTSHVWLEKKPHIAGDMYRMIELQTSGLGRDDVFDLAVNLARRPFRSFSDPRNYQKHISAFHVRLAPCLWETEPERKAMDHWWHFNNSYDELHVVLADVLEKTLKFGLPFLENPNSTWWTWAGRKPDEG